MQVYEKYVNLARDAFSSGDRIAAESYQQYAEHYFRIINDTTDPQRPAAERPGQERPGQERPAQERPAQEGSGQEGSGQEGSGQEHPGQERPEAEQVAGDRSGPERPKGARNPYPTNAEQPFVDGGEGTPTADGNGQTPAAKPETVESGDVVEAPVAEAPVADGQSDGAPAPEKKAKPRGRGRPRTRAKAGNGAVAEPEAEGKATPESGHPCEAGEPST